MERWAMKLLQEKKADQLSYCKEKVTAFDLG